MTFEHVYLQDNIVTGSENETRLDPCVTLTVEQAQLMVDAKKPHPPGTHSRTKRKFDSHIITNKWDMPIKYKFDGKHCEDNYFINFTVLLFARYSLDIILKTNDYLQLYLRYSNFYI